MTMSKQDFHIRLHPELARRLDKYLKETYPGSRGKSLVIKKAISDYLDKVGAKK